MIDSEDHRIRRCPRLGHDVSFRYCRTQEGQTICPRILDCWWEIFDVAAFLKANLPPDEWERLSAREFPPRIVSLVELIRQAQERAQKNADSGGGEAGSENPRDAAE